jgi:hypothetical protein
MENRSLLRTGSSSRNLVVRTVVLVTAATMLFGLAARNGRPNEPASSSSRSPVSGSTGPAAHSHTIAVRHRGGHRGATGGGLVAVHDPGRVTGMLIGPCRARDHGMLPDPSCTPGTVDPAVTQANIDSTICTPG